MKTHPRLILFLFILACVAINCEDIERHTLLVTTLDARTDSVILVGGTIADLADGEVVASYGHCWSDLRTPTIEDARSEFHEILSHASSHFSTRFDDFLAHRTYYFRTYVILQSGTARYGNVLAITTAETRGRWERQPDFFKTGHSVRYAYECGNVDITFRNAGFLMSGAFYDDAVIAGNGYMVQGISAMNYSQEGEYCVDFDNGKFSLQDGTLDFRIPYFQLYREGEWEPATSVDISLAGFGGVCVVDGNLMYIGATTVHYLSTIGQVFYEMYTTVGSGPLYTSNSFFVYDIQNGIWQKLAAFEGQTNVYGASFRIGERIYVVSGMSADFTHSREVWAYDIPTDSWLRLNDFPGTGRIHPSSFVVNGKAYIGGGYTAFSVEGDASEVLVHHPISPVNDFYEYAPEEDTWRRVADFPGDPRGGPFSFGVGNYGYVGCGASAPMGDYYKDFWRFDPIADRWSRLDDFPGHARFGATGFSNTSVGAAGFGYVVSDFERLESGLYNPTFDSDLWFFDPQKN